MRSNAKRGEISPRQLFLILFTSRLFSLLISVRSLGDFVFYFVLSFGLFLAVALLLNRLKSKTAMFISGLFCLALTALTVFGYVEFTSKAVHPSFGSALLVALIAAAVIYAVSLRIEALSRFSLFCAATLAFALMISVLTNLKGFRFEYLKAVEFDISLNLLAAIECLDMPLIYFLLCGRVKSPPLLHYKKALLASFVSAFLILVMCYGVMGNAARNYVYPAFTLFQLSEIGSFTRLDIAFTGSAVLALFLKCSVLTYCGIYGITGGKFEKN